MFLVYHNHDWTLRPNPIGSLAYVSSVNVLSVHIVIATIVISSSHNIQL